MITADLIIGFDFGLRRIGVAVGNCLTKNATPLRTILANKGEPNWKEVKAIIKAWRPVACVVGLPTKIDGTEQYITQAARQFAQKLESELNEGVNSRLGLGLGPTNNYDDERICNKAENSSAKDIDSQQLELRRGANERGKGVNSRLGLGPTNNYDAERICNKAENSSAKSIRVYMVDERLSTIEARSQLFTEGGYKKIKKQEVDSIAACVILQQWLSSL